VKKLSVIAITSGIVIAIIAFGFTLTQIDTVIPPNGDKEIPNEKIKVIASFYPLYEFTRNVAGEKADVSSFVPIGVEPHDWEPSSGDILKLKSARVFVYNGGNFEPYVTKLIQSGEYNTVIFVETIAGINLLKAEDHKEHLDDFIEEIEHILHEVEDDHISTSNAISLIRELIHEHEGDDHEHDGILEKIEEVLHKVEDGRTSESAAIKLINKIVEHSGDHGHTHTFEYDPHIWLDPILAKQQVVVIKEALVRADPMNAAYYEENAKKYNAKLDSLDAKIRSELSSCKKDTFVPFHNAFSYLAQRYGLHVSALSGIAPESEATAAELKRLVDFVRENEIKVVFAEDLVDPRLAQVLANEAGAQVLILSPLEGLSKSEMAAGKTYLDKMEENITNLKVALECQ
jgi:zinc transport system substrate-binding protein